jgi:TonB-linked SusC/RagA family outer membrane protein
MNNHKRNLFILSLLAGFWLPTAAQTDSTALTGNTFVDQKIEIGANKDLTRAQSTAAVSVISNDQVDKRSAKNIGNSILGQGNGLVSLDGSGLYYAINPTFYVRGLQSLSTSAPLILVDGIERDITLVSPEEVDHVTILKDAAAVALYGYKGANGAIQIVTKRGKYNSNTIRVNYDHLFNSQIDRPEFINGHTYALAMNEALMNEGASPRYSDQELAAYRDGTYPYQYPSVDWVENTFRKKGVTNKYAIEFSGGGERFRYFTMLNLLSDKGFIKNFDKNDGYSTQDKYVRGNLRTNLDIDLTPTTDMKVNLLGVLSEMSRPGNAANLWNMVYTLPSNAFPIQNENGDWGGTSTFAGTNNPVAISSDAAYYKLHERALFADVTLQQDLKYWIEGLSLTAKLGYDTYSTLYEDHSKTFVYGNYPVTGWSNGAPTLGDYWSGGAKTEMNKGSGTDTYQRRLTFNAGVNFERHLTDDDYLYSQLKYDYDYSNSTGVNQSIYRQNISLWGHYAHKNRYLVDLALVYSGSSRLAPDTKWSFSPTISAGWVLSEEDFLKDIDLINFLKLRTSYGIINADYLPGDNVWTYYTQSYSQAGGGYAFGSGYDAASYGPVSLGQMAAVNPTHEKAHKFNIGIDATLFGGLNVEMDYFFQKRKDIWVSGNGYYSSLIGFDAPFANEGVVNQHGFELSLDYTKHLGDLTLNAGANLMLYKNSIKSMAEEPRVYDNLVQTGNPLSSTYGLIAEGLFTSNEEIANSPTQTFSTVRPGDIKYRDVNGDKVIDANDVCRIGYSTACPELFYNFHLGGEYKYVGIDLMFQGVGRYSAVLNTTGMYWGLINNTSLSQYVYDNRWSLSNNDPNALFPRLSSSSNANNYQTSTFWLRNRSYMKLRHVELYFNFPQQLLAATKFIHSARLYVRGVDLFTIDDLDKVDAASYGATNPLTKSVVVGLSVTF